MMNILYCGDQNMEDGLMLSVLSLCRHTEQPLHIWVLTMTWASDGRTFMPVTEACILALDAWIKRRNVGSFVRRLLLEDDQKAAICGVNTATRFTPYCMLRLFADALPELPDRLLYLDADVLCRCNPQELYAQDIRGYELAGVLDYYGSWFFRKKWYRRDYINSGVLLLNMPLIRENGLFERCRRLCREEEMFMPDQSAINRLSQAKKILPGKYNEQRRLRKDTCFQHFTTAFRLFPWLHTVTVKPWEIDRVHRELKLDVYDELYEEYGRLRSFMKTGAKKGKLI